MVDMVGPAGGHTPAVSRPHPRHLAHRPHRHRRLLSTLKSPALLLPLLRAPHPSRLRARAITEISRVVMGSPTDGLQAKDARLRTPTPIRCHRPHTAHPCSRHRTELARSLPSRRMQLRSGMEQVCGQDEHGACVEPTHQCRRVFAREAASG